MLKSLLILLSVMLFGCGGGGGGESGSPVVADPPDTVGTGPYSVLASWTGNRETAVNTTGGGYKVYYSTSPGFNTASASIKTAPYVSGATAPTSVSITGLDAGTYYFKVVAYSALVPPGSSSGAKSGSSSEFSVTLP